MPDEWICEECGHSTPIDPGNSPCPSCNSKMSKLDDADDLKNDDPDEDLKTLDPMEDLDIDLDDAPAAKKGSALIDDEF